MEYNNIDPRDSEAIRDAQNEAYRASLVKRETENAFYKLLMTDEGAKLIKHWEESFVMGQIAYPNDTMVQIGIRQGQANFVMHIKQVVEQLKKGVKDG